jgi:hypothetical protein
MWFSSSCGRIELQITLAQAQAATHPGPCDMDVLALSNDRKIARQLAKIDPSDLARELGEYGAWDETELADHAQNLQRILWIACGYIVEEAFMKGRG